MAAAPVAGDTQARTTDVGEWLAAGARVNAAAVTLPEWNYTRQFHRPDWVSVREHIAPAGNSALLLRSNSDSERASSTDNRLPGTRRQRRSYEGETLDIDACICLIANRKLGHDADQRIYRRRINQTAPRSLVILLDTSLSMGAIWPLPQQATSTCLDRAKMAAMTIARRALARGDRVAIYGFCSDGRHALHMAAVKKFGEFNSAANTHHWLGRLAGLAPAYSTRLGGALRYAQQLFDDEINTEREIVVLGDGEISDIDIVDPQYLHEDAQQARLELERAGIRLHYQRLLESSILLRDELHR